MSGLSELARMLIPVGGNIVGGILDGMNVRAARDYSSIDMQLERLRAAGLPLATLLGNGYSEQSAQPKDMNDMGAAQGIQAYNLSQMQLKQQQVMDKQIEELDLRIQQLQRDAVRDKEKLENVDMATGEDTLIDPGDSGIVRAARRERFKAEMENVIKTNDDKIGKIAIDVQGVLRDVQRDQHGKGNLTRMAEAQLDKVLSENQNVKTMYRVLLQDIKNKKMDLLLKNKDLRLKEQAIRMGKVQFATAQQDYAHEGRMYPMIEGITKQNLSFTEFVNALKYSVKESMDNMTDKTIPFLGKVTQGITDGIYLWMLKDFQLPSAPTTTKRSINIYNNQKTD